MRNYFLILILSFLSGFLHAQYFDGGIVAGLSASQVDGDNYAGFNKLGITAGGWVSRNISENLAGQLELCYTGKGAYFTDKDASPPIYHKRSLHYIDIPVLLDLFYRDKVVFNLGVAPELLVKHMLEDKDGIDPDDPLDYNTLTMSGIAGVGYEFMDRLTFNIRYNYSIIPMSPHESGQVYRWNRGYYNNALTVTLFYRISSR